jgi:hypothetical protein
MGDRIHLVIHRRVLEMRPATVQLERTIHLLSGTELIVAMLHIQLLIGTTDVLGNRVHGFLDTGSVLKLDASDH